MPKRKPRPFRARDEFWARHSKGCSICGARISAKGLCIHHYHKRYHQDNLTEIRRKHREYYSKKRNDIAKKSKTLQGKYLQYRCSAKRRGLTMMGIEDFSKYWKKPCAYCGEEISTIGLDRLNSSKGYTTANVIPCCATHNRMKSDMSVKDFVKYCQKVRHPTLDRL